jgi:hypothetical protein
LIIRFKHPLLYKQTNCCTFTVQLPIVANVNIELSDDIVLLLLDSDDDVYHVVGFFDTSPISLRTRTPTQPLVTVDVYKSRRTLLCMKLPCYGSPYLSLPLHSSASSLGLSIVDILKLTKSKRKSKYDTTTINFDTVNVRDIKYLPPLFMMMFCLCCS